MLDKSVPFVGLYMLRSAGVPVPEFPLPEGFSFAFYKDGDESNWARIETSVLEFDSEFAALMYFNKKFKPHVDELYKRCLFIENKDGKKIATTTAWWHHIQNERRAWLHWVAVDPDYQGLGLGKVISSRATNLMIELEGDVNIYLHTQTWSHRAIGIYEKIGYIPTDEKILYKGNRENNYKKAMRILDRLKRG
jgi:GNAT superfamily N-acetyltransferase